MLDIVKALWNNRPVRRKGHWLYIGNIRISFETMWRTRSQPYWFYAKYNDVAPTGYDGKPRNGMRRICIPFFTFDILPKGYFR